MSLSQLMQPSEQRLIKEKLAKVIADAAIREWPEQWTHFAEMLKATMTQELSLLILTRLAQILYGDEELSRKWRGRVI